MQNKKPQSTQISKHSGTQGNEPIASENSETEAAQKTKSDTMQNNKPDNPNNLLDAIKSLKDYALIISLFCYLCGFLLWAFYLYKYDTGFLIIHDINLIISGLFPVSLVLIIIYIKNNFENLSINFIKDSKILN